MGLGSIYHRIVLASPKVEVALRCLYWNNVKTLKKFRGASSEGVHMDEAKPIDFNKIIAYLRDNGVNAFMNIKNKTNAEIKIISAENTVSQKTELHTHMDENGVKKMRQIPEIIIPANGSVVLKPGDLHIMLIGLNQPLQENQKVDIKINFADGSTKIISPLVIKK